MKKYHVAKLLKTRYGAIENLFARSLSAYFIVSAYQFASARRRGLSPIVGWKEFVLGISLPVKLLWIALLFAGLTVLYRVAARKQRHIGADFVILMFSAVLFALCIVWRSNSFYFGVAAAAIAVVFANYAMGKTGTERFERLSDAGAGAVVFVTAALVIAFIAATTVANFLNYGTQCFDMGVFVQTFHSLKEHFTAMTTCERAKPMSHFRIHGSYIFYLFLPVYMLFPRGETLLIAQAFFSIAGVVPLFLMARKHGFKGFALISMCLTYVFYGGLVLSCYYEFHENAFLPTILMWLLYAVDRKNIPLFYIMSALTCVVKEDAALYVICIGLFFFFEEKESKRIHGIVITVLSTVYFILVMRWLNQYGDGAFMMSTRFGNLMLDPKDGLVGVIRHVFEDPAYLISLLLQESTLLFFVQTMLPLLFLPFLTRKIHRFLLLLPYAVMNLVIGAGYGFAANIGFQYIFGPSCLLIYMALRNVEELPKERRNMLVITAAVVTVVTTVAMASDKWGFVEYHKGNKDYYQSAKECIESVPEDAAVLATTFFVPHMANRDQIYLFDDGCFVKDEAGNALEMPGLENYDFCVLNKQDPLTAQAEPFLKAAGWTVYAQSEGDFVIIYER